MTETVQNWRSYLHANSGPGIFPLPHPVAQHRLAEKNPWFAEELLPVLRQHVEMRL